MSKICYFCHRGPKIGHSRSHSNKATKRWFALNLQTKKINGKRVKICTRCLKKLSKTNPHSHN